MTPKGVVGTSPLRASECSRVGRSRNFHCRQKHRFIARPPVVVNSNEEAKNCLRIWINEKALPWLRAEVKRTLLGTTDSTVLSLEDAGFRLEASPQRSGDTSN